MEAAVGGRLRRAAATSCGRRRGARRRRFRPAGRHVSRACRAAVCATARSAGCSAATAPPPRMPAAGRGAARRSGDRPRVAYAGRPSAASSRAASGTARRCGHERQHRNAIAAARLPRSAGSRHRRLSRPASGARRNGRSRPNTAAPASSSMRSESPLAWLARRRGRDGRALIEPHQLQAGERLRADFTRAHMMPRTTSNWSSPMASGRRGAGGDAPPAFSDTMIAARQRVHQALDAVGPEFGGLLLDVCCFLKGLEDIERERAWPARSAKVVLQLALDRLARHYGYAGAGARARRMRRCAPGWRRVRSFRSSGASSPPARALPLRRRGCARPWSAGRSSAAA